ncbi:MAG: 5'/3'-nucleotidase SurE [Firmicutes bacterium]|jgi:5'-nucleotidase|nr:5'/3'-nucleotidase SurE [Bacillota bacterium]
MRVLVTNDDGIRADGIKHLIEYLAEKCTEVFVVAPEYEKSATSHSLTLHNPLRLKSYDFKRDNVKAFSCDGNPADCIKIAMDVVLEEKPDIIISGINKGPNLGNDVMYSGTVAGATEAIYYDVPSIAISMDGRNHYKYETGVAGLDKVISNLDKFLIEKNEILNVNVPNVSIDEIKGYKLTTLGRRVYENVYEKRIDTMGKEYYWLGGTPKSIENDTHTDVVAIKDNYITITPIKVDYTDYGKYEQYLDLSIEIE